VSSADGKSTSLFSAAAIGWVAASTFYFYQYVLRSAPSVMIPQLGEAFGLTAVGLASLIGLFYYGYAPFSLVAGVAMDQLGPRKVVPFAAALVGIGALLFGAGNPLLAQTGRLLQGAGGVFALVSAVYIATNYFPASRGATLVGATQMFGMAGGSAGQFLVGPSITAGLDWNDFWFGAGIIGIVIAGLLFFFVPESSSSQQPHHNRAREVGQTFLSVFRNPQSIMCGLIAGLLFIPTTIFDMVWGVRFLQESHDLPYNLAVMHTASVPFGWIIGCPLLGMLSDRLGRRKPVIIGGAAVLLICMALILRVPMYLFPPFSLGLLAGIASGAAMLPYTVIKEANRPEHSGTATGVINFINFSLSALLGPVFGSMLMRASGGGERTHEHYQTAFEPLLYGLAIAILLTFFLKETGPKGRPASAPRDARAPFPAIHNEAEATRVVKKEL
jgi:MFS family permease